MALLDDDTRKQVIEALSAMEGPVELVFFTQDFACRDCRDQQEIVTEFASLSDKVSMETCELRRDDARAQELGVVRVPCTVVKSADQDYGIRFYGITSGYEFGSLLEAVLMVSHGRTELDPSVEALAKAIRHPLHLEVAVTTTCPYCPRMVGLAHQLAFINPNIEADMIEASSFPQLVQKYEVNGVPRTIINGRPSFEGAIPPMSAMMEILKQVEPAEYERIDAMIRQARGERKVGEVDPEHRYDTIIIGAGPAAMSAAIYAARKAMDVAVLGTHVGGQITDTATVENWLGIPEIGGAELAEQFRHHMERYRLAENLHVEVSRIESDDEGFSVQTTGGKTYRGRSVIYCAGKRYRRLGVPGEERYLGRGIAFCATCDAPLFRDKRVVVVGGGNSAFTAVRDLIPFVQSVDLVHVLDTFQADPTLVQQVRGTPNVTLHTSVEVRSFLGDVHLSAVRLTKDDGERFDLPADGVFLEIGLEPNSAPVAELVRLNDHREIIVTRDQATSMPGVFAAGDVTDEPDKQIIVAAAAGAKAALAAHRRLAAFAPAEGAVKA